MENTDQKDSTFRFIDVDVTTSASELKVGRTKKIKFLEWAKVLVLLHEQGIESVTFGTVDNSVDEYPAFYDTNGNNPFIKVWVKLDEDRFEITYPVIANQGDTFKVVERPSQLDMEFSKARAFVKCVAINTGLGLKLWLTETQDLANVVDESSMDNKQLTEEVEDTMVKLAMALKDRDQAYALIGTTHEIYDEFCNRDDIVAFEQKMGWYATLKVAIHNLNSIEKQNLEGAEKGVVANEKVETLPTAQKGIEMTVTKGTAFELFKEEFKLKNYDDINDLVSNQRNSADDMKSFAKRLGIEYTGKVGTREVILKMWNNQ